MKKSKAPMVEMEVEEVEPTAVAEVEVSDIPSLDAVIDDLQEAMSSLVKIKKAQPSHPKSIKELNKKVEDRMKAGE